MSEEFKASTEEKTEVPKRGRKKKITHLENLRNGKLFIAGQVMQKGEVMEVHPSMLKDDYQMRIIKRAITLGLVKSV